MKDNIERVVVLGASDNPMRYSNQAIRSLLSHGHSVVPVHPRAVIIDGVPVVHRLADIEGPVDTLTLYLRPSRSEPLAPEILELEPGRVIFNPGTESGPLQTRLEEAGIPYQEACTLVLLQSGQFSTDGA